MNKGFVSLAILAVISALAMNRERIVETVKSVIQAPLGIRLNNPGNIEINTANPWMGEVRPSAHGRYTQFSHPVYGIRAMAKTLATYRAQYGLTTIREVIQRWAPKSENDTEAYIRSVSQRAGLAPDKDIRTALPAVIAAMIYHENGQQPYDMQMIESAIELANRG